MCLLVKYTFKRPVEMVFDLLMVKTDNGSFNYTIERLGPNFIALLNGNIFVLTVAEKIC